MFPRTPRRPGRVAPRLVRRHAHHAEERLEPHARPFWSTAKSKSSSQSTFVVVPVRDAPRAPGGRRRRARRASCPPSRRAPRPARSARAPRRAPRRRARSAHPGRAPSRRSGRRRRSTRRDRSSGSARARARSDRGASAARAGSRGSRARRPDPGVGRRDQHAQPALDPPDRQRPARRPSARPRPQRERTPPEGSAPRSRSRPRSDRARSPAPARARADAPDRTTDRRRCPAWNVTPATGTTRIRGSSQRTGSPVAASRRK